MVGTGPVLRKGVLLPRRNSTGPAHLKCRNKGKVIIRVGNISPAINSMSDGRFTRWSRRLVSVMALIASLAALLLIVHNQYGLQGFGGVLQRALPLDTLTPAGNAAGLGRGTSTLSAAEESRYRALAGYLAKRYRVSQDVTYDLVGHAHAVGQRLGLDPLLIIAVIAVESGFNPIAESVAGARGLMQIIPKYHSDKLEEHGGHQAVFDPAANIVVGAQILKEYIRLTGNLGIALQMYAGALGDSEDQYTNKVLNEKHRLQQVLTQSVARSTPVAPIKTVSARPLLLSPLE